MSTEIAMATSLSLTPEPENRPSCEPSDREMSPPMPTFCLPEKEATPASSTQGSTTEPQEECRSEKRGVKRRYTDSQRAVLEECFAKKQKLSKEEREEVATKLGLTSVQVAKWFQNKKAVRRSAKGLAKTSDTESEESPELKELQNLTPEQLDAEIVLSEKKIKETEALLEAHRLWLGILERCVTEEVPDGKAGADPVAPEWPMVASLWAQPSKKRFSKEQQKTLQAIFDVTDRPDAAQRKKLVEKTGLLPEQVSKWFQNRRHENLKAEKSKKD
ncbi:hypothetical protein QR680_013456 [Steinernema hermaphroditum]|uniref:Homeobox domain-containing protein n=1 Tax=Steinernema hermaphroditum TaxID=289476 RepID=A0AA39M1K2_9BILA|nr:hypothetical protein QR680_013456 [Steinernema hermaphroditum]